MRKLIVPAIVASLGGALLAGNVAAEPRWEMGLAPGYAIPVGVAKDIIKGSFALKADASYRVVDWLNAGFELGYSFAHKYEGRFGGGFGAFTSDTDAQVLQLTPVAKLGKELEAGAMKWRPYGVVGAGIYMDQTRGGTITLTDLGNTRTPLEKDKWKGYFGFNVGVGADFRVHESWLVGLDARYHHYLTKSDINLDDKKNDPIQYITPSLRLAYLF